MRVILFIALGVAAWLIYKLYFQKLIAQGKPGMIKIALIIAGFAFIAMALTGRAHVIFLLIGGLMTQVMRLMPLLVRYLPMIQQFINVRKVATPSSGGQSKVTTRMLVMMLDHDTGDIDGKVIGGDFSGRTLGSLSQAELQQLHRECQHSDPEAVRLLEAYVSRVLGEDWEQPESPGNRGSQPADRDSATPSVTEAYEILGVPESAERDEIVDAHRRLMSKMHPDKGGSNYLAAKINAAKEVLLSRAA